MRLSPSNSYELVLIYPLSIPKMSTKTIESYITSTKKGTQVDAKHLVTEEQRKQANGVRIVEDPVAVKNKAAEVFDFYFYRILR